MKKTIFTLAITVLIAGTMLTNCQSSATKVENAEDKVQEANEQVVIAKQELMQARKDSIIQFKEESQEKISNYEKAIADVRKGIANDKKEIKAGYENSLAVIEQKNNELKIKLANYSEEKMENWESFKEEFNHDVDELGKALKDLTVNNVK
ncbi:hypothetical protein ACFLQ5_02210 [Bacteroidota bacterium]